MAEQSQPSEIGLTEAAGRISSLLGGGDPEPTVGTPKKASAAVEETEASADLDDETVPEGDEAADQSASSEGEGSGDVEDTEGEADGGLKPDTLVTVKIDGKTQQVTLKEALDGYQRQSDYSRKMQKLRDEAVAFQADRQQVEAERAQYGQLLGALRQQLEQMQPQEPDWEKLHREDPLNFPIVEKQWRDYKERLAATRSEQDRLASIAAQQEQAALRQQIEQGRQFLLEKMPEWKDTAKWDAARSNLREYGRNVGYSDEELAQAYDPRAVLVLEKARRYDALMANRPKPTPAQGPKPMKAGSNASSPKQATDVQRMRQRLKATGRADDAARLFGLLDQRK